MTVPDDPWWREFIAADPPHTAKMAVVRADGRPHVTPVWIALDGDDIVFTTHSTGVKATSIRREPRVCLAVDDERPPFSFVMVEGVAELSEDLDAVRHWAGVVGGRYMGRDRIEEFAARNGVPGELLVRITPTHVAYARDLAD